MNFEFANPELLWLLLALPVLAILKSKSGRTGSIIFSSVSIAKSAASSNRTWIGGFLIFLRLLALALIIFALARPQKGTGHTQREESGIDIALVLDVSGSMSALDFSTHQSYVTRLEVVKKVVSEFIKKRPNDRIGMLVFATNPFLLSPMTLNHDWLLKNLDRVELGLIDGQSTAIGSAIAMSTNHIKDLKNSKSKIVILLTDGESNAGSITPLAAAEAAKSFDVKIYTIAAGSNGIVQRAAMNQDQTLLKDASGRLVYGGNAVSSIDEETLKKIAAMTNGKFYHATNQDELRRIYEDIDKLEKTSVKIQSYTTYEELFHYFVFAALALLALELILTNTRYRALP